MNKLQYKDIENYMIRCMKDSAHDRQHIYRVLYFALDIAQTCDNVDMDVLVASCLLHDIGREQQFKHPEMSHAVVGGEMAYRYLMENGWDGEKAEHVKDCITSHRFRGNNPPDSIEAKILFDSDKLDVAGTLGIARTLIYLGNVAGPLYSVDENGLPLPGKYDEKSSFFREYNYKLKNVYDRFYTKRGREIARSLQKPAKEFYESMYNEVKSMHEKGTNLIEKFLNG